MITLFQEPFHKSPMELSLEPSVRLGLRAAVWDSMTYRSRTLGHITCTVYQLWIHAQNDSVLVSLLIKILWNPWSQLYIEMGNESSPPAKWRTQNWCTIVSININNLVLRLYLLLGFKEKNCCKYFRDKRNMWIPDHCRLYDHYYYFWNNLLRHSNYYYK